MRTVLFYVTNIW